MSLAEAERRHPKAIRITWDGKRWLAWYATGAVEA